MSITAVSQGGKTIILPIGTYDGLREGENARLYQQSGKGLPLLTLIATGVAAKVEGSRSYWQLTEVGVPQFIRKGQKIILLRQDQFLNGRQFPVESRKVVLNDNREIKTYLKDQAALGVPAKVFRVGKGQKASKTLKLGDQAVGSTIKATTFDEWQEPGLEKLEGMDHEVWAKEDPAFHEQIDPAEVQQEEKERVFARESNGMANKINMLEHGLYGLYAEEEDFTDQQTDDKKTIIQGLTKKYQEDRGEESRQARATMKRLGATDVRWSSDLSDKELRDYFVEMGITRERFRQQYALNNLLSHEIYLHYGVNLYGDKNSQEQKTALASLWEIGYELFLGRFKFSWHPFTISAGIGLGRNGHVINEQVVTSSERFYFLMARWYPWHYPTTILQWQPWIGAGLEVGTAEVGLTTYRAPLTPLVAAGIKYRFTGGDERFALAPWGWGLEALGNYRKRRYDDQDSASQYTRNESRIYVGTNIFF